MKALAARHAPPPALWESIPLEVFLSAFAVILAGALSYVGVMP
ncbi:hypothetical protein ACLBWX_02955 [Methylobacterium sp. M6A4_1b]